MATKIGRVLTSGRSFSTQTLKWSPTSLREMKVIQQMICVSTILPWIYVLGTENVIAQLHAFFISIENKASLYFQLSLSVA